MNASNLSVEHFRNILDKETENLNSLCDRWSKLLEGADTNGNDDAEQEELFGAIRTTIGQAKLLMSQRFKQFSQLIDSCEFNTGPRPTRLDDLLGFWEMISFQVVDVKDKFKSLEIETSK